MNTAQQSSRQGKCSCWPIGPYSLGSAALGLVDWCTNNIQSGARQHEPLVLQMEVGIHEVVSGTFGLHQN